jgi:predicted PurR-regulated permease PerM
LIHQISLIDLDVNSMVNTIRDLAGRYQVIEIFGFPVDLSPVYQQVITSLTSLVTSIAPRSLNIFTAFASGFASTLIGLVLTLVVSFYLVKDAHSIGRYLDNLAPEDYRDEVMYLRQQISEIWNAFFRGQLLLCLIIGVVTGSALWLVGVRQALMLGVLAGVLEIIPNLGPVLAAVPAVLLALLQGSTRLAISPLWFAILVAGLYVIIQQVENNFLVPRIIGGSVKLHPVVVLLGVVAGASMAGILGIFLAAPVLATIRVVARYCYDKLQDKPILPPAPEPARTEGREPATRPSPHTAPGEAADSEGPARQSVT